VACDWCVPEFGSSFDVEGRHVTDGSRANRVCDEERRVCDRSDAQTLGRPAPALSPSIEVECTPLGRAVEQRYIAGDCHREQRETVRTIGPGRLARLPI